MTRYLSLAEFFWLAEQVTGVDGVTLAKTSRGDLADSALNAPAASFGGQEFYADLWDKAAVLTLTGMEPPSVGWQQTGGVGIVGDVLGVERDRLGSGPAGCRRR